MVSWHQPPLPPRLADTDETPFVGRARELEKLDAIWDNVQTGQRQAIFMTGEPGSGKTRLVSLTARALHEQGAGVLLGSLSPDLAYPYRPFVEALDVVFRSVEVGALTELIPDSAEPLLQVTPSISFHRPDFQKADDTGNRYRKELFDSFVDTIDSLATDRPIALILEDVHWASEPTQQLLAHTVEATDSAPILIICTLRNTAPDRSEKVTHMIAELYRLPGVHRFDLRSLDSTEIEAFVTARGTGPAESREAAALLRDLTGGNPFFLTEVWRELESHGGVQSLKSGEFRAPESIADAMGRRLDAYSEPAREVVTYAAVLGDVFRADTIAGAMETAAPEVLDAIGEATASGLVEQGPGAGRFSFVHSLVRQTILESLPPSESSTIHHRLAIALEPVFDNQPQLAQDLARLFQGAAALGFQEKAVQYLTIAAEEADRSLAFEEAAQLWRQAARSGTVKSEADWAYLRAADSYLKAADFGRARTIYRELSGSTDPRLATHAAIGYEDASWRVGLSGASATHLLEQALQMIEADHEDPLYIKASAALGRAYAWAGRLDEADEVGARSIETARNLGDDSLLADVLHTNMRVVTPKSRQKGFELATELQEIARRTGNYEALAQSGVFLIMTAYMNGEAVDWDLGVTAVRESVQRTGSPFWSWVHLCTAYVRQMMQGEFSAALDTALQGLELGYQFGTDNTEGPHGLQMFMVHRETGGLEQFRDMISGDPAKDGSWAPGLLAMYTELGMKQPARQLLWGLVESDRGVQENEAVWPAIVAFMADAAIELGDTELLVRVRPLIAEFAGLNLMAGASVCTFGSADRYLAQIDALLGDVDLAEQEFQRALDMDRLAKSAIHQSETIARYSQFLERQGKTEKSETLRRHATDLATSIGHHRVLRMLDRSDFADLPDGLTPREVDVLRLLAGGATNREIGDELFISQNTAANHVRSILMKTMAANRTQAAIYAAERGLLD